MLNRYGRRVDLMKETQHILHATEDYQHLKSLNITTVREGIRWSQVEYKPYHYNWKEVHVLFDAAKRTGIQQIWDICHFGMPDDLTPLHPQFTNRLVRICLAFLIDFRKYFKDDYLIITPINEVSFFSWLGGEVGATIPYTKATGWTVKYQLCKAYIAAINALKTCDDKIIILTTEPLVDIVPQLNATEAEKFAALKLHEEQYQVTDIICGNMCTELGGSQKLIDIIGYNFYFNNRFTPDHAEVISWVNEHYDERCRALHILLQEGYKRYNRPIVLAETSHRGEHRKVWMDHIIEETDLAIEAGVPLLGICWYPVLDRPDWDELHIWHDSGIWNKQTRTSPGQIHEPLVNSFKAYELIKKNNY